MREYYFLTGLQDSPYDLTMADALHLGATCSGLGIYSFIDQTVFMDSLDAFQTRKDSGFFIQLPPQTITAFEKMLFKGKSTFESMFGSDDPGHVRLNFAFIDERYTGSIPIGSPFNPEPDRPFKVELSTINPEMAPAFGATPGPTITLSDLLCWTDDLEKLADKGRVKRRADDTSPAASDRPDPDRQQYPPHLEALTIAWRKFWKNADPTDRTACPKKTDVVDWLIDQGFSAKSADAGATIIKPQWARDKGL